MTAPARLPGAGEVSDMLARQIQTLCGQLLSAGQRKGNFWTVGDVQNTKGASMYVVLYGNGLGVWRDTKTGEFGDALDLVAACLHRGDKKLAYRWALDWLGVTSSGMAQRPREIREAPPDQSVPDDETRRRQAHAIWLNAEPSIRFTPVDGYLRDRGINLERLGHQPRALRFEPELYHAPSKMKFPAMVAAISGPDGTHVATHRTWLERVGGGWIKARVSPNKMVLGRLGGGSIRLSKGQSKKSLKDAAPDEVVLIGEGIETCLSVAIAVPELRVISAVSLGNLGSVWLPDQIRKVRILADRDEAPEAKLGLQRALEQHMAKGRIAEWTYPPFGKDFNDTIRGWA